MVLPSSDKAALGILLLLLLLLLLVVVVVFIIVILVLKFFLLHVIGIVGREMRRVVGLYSNSALFLSF